MNVVSIVDVNGDFIGFGFVYIPIDLEWVVYGLMEWIRSVVYV